MLKHCGMVAEVEDTVAFKTQLHKIKEEDRAKCAKYLSTHAYHPGKFMLAKYALRKSGRSLGWLHSTCKYDHSRRDVHGKRVRWVERI